jgi:lysophospholipase L1-like esterase
MKTGLVFSGGIDSISDPITTVVLVGDSISWGYGLEANNTIAYYMQKRINESYGYTPAKWGLGDDIVARSITTDDISNKTSFNGGTTGVSRHITGSGNITNPTIGMMPFSACTYNSSNGGSVATISGWNNGGVMLGPDVGSGVGKLTFSVKYPDNVIGSDAYLSIKMMGNGYVRVQNGADVNYLESVGGSLSMRVFSSSTTTLVRETDTSYTLSSQPQNNHPKIDSYFYASGFTFPTGPNTLRFTTWPGPNGSGSFNANLSNNTPSFGSYIERFFDWHTGYPINKKIGPNYLNGSNFNQTFTIEYASGSPVITGIHPFVRSPSNMPIIQIHGRNSYGINDYYSSLSDSVDKRPHNLLRANVFLNPAWGEYGYGGVKNIIYIIQAGIVNIVDAGNSRQITPTKYYEQLYNMASKLMTPLTNGTITNYQSIYYPTTEKSRVVLTIPPIPIGWNPPTGYTFGDYKKQIISVANNLGLSYIDLSTVITSSADYSDNLHPNAAGAEKIAKKYINMLQLLQI